MIDTTKQLLGAGLLAAASLMASTHASAQPVPYPSSFKTREIQANGTTLHVRVGGTGPAVVLICVFQRSRTPVSV